MLNLIGVVVALLGLCLTVSVLSPLWLLRRVRHRETLTATEYAATQFRFFYSQHVRDLRMIFWAAWVLFFYLFFAFFYFGIEQAFTPLVPTNGSTATVTDPLRRFLDAYGLFPPIAIALGAVVAWSYRTAGLRLGVVDLFACEIDSLCRVGTIVDIAGIHANWYEHPSLALKIGRSAESEPREEYFPVFDKNAKDLQILEASIVINITAFYTYMKSFRDLRRVLIANLSLVEAAEEKDQIETVRTNIFNVVYMLFLAYESARKATKDLVEFQPTAAECILTILITELKCFSLLLRYCERSLDKSDIRARRLNLRKQDYEVEVKEVYHLVMQHPNCESSDSERDWRPAFRLVDELSKQYELAMGQRLA